MYFNFLIEAVAGFGLNLFGNFFFEKSLRLVEKGVMEGWRFSWWIKRGR